MPVILITCLVLPHLAVVYLAYTTVKYRKLTVKLTEVINNMYCKKDGCNNYKYNTQPMDGGLGYMDAMCATHMSERMEAENKQN